MEGEEAAMATHLRPAIEEQDRWFDHSEPSGPMRSGNRRTLWALLAIAAIIAAVVVGVVLRNDSTTATTTTPITAPPGTAPATSATTSASTVTLPADTSLAAWPQVGNATRYDDPVAVARGFAVDFLGFDNPVVGQFQAGDSRSGEVELRPRATGPVTTVLVRQLGSDGTWWVLGAATDNIRVSQPSALDTISSPVRLAGTSTAFEATVGVLIYADGQTVPLARSFVMGGANGEFGPFDSTIEFETPHNTNGTVVLFTQSMEDGRMWEASVVRVRFAS
jgi:hypothetical protein